MQHRSTLLKKTDKKSLPYGHIAVIGAGAWGTTLALVAARAGRRVTLWSRETEVAAGIEAVRENGRFLPAVDLPPLVTATADLADTMVAETLLLAVPAQHCRSILESLAPHLAPGVPLVLCAKGIERGTGKLLTEVLSECVPQVEPAILSGPSFAREVAGELPTAVTIAARKHIVFRLLATLGHPSFRPYASEDLIGVALGGAAKNVYAIGCGIVSGLGLGENARAALLTRSFAELCRLGTVLGARNETLMGLSGLGDLVLTATSLSSRNFAFGFRLGEGRSRVELSAPGYPLAEGVETAAALVARARRHAIELPVAEAIADILAGTLDLPAAIPRLMGRPFKAE
jgi:glycerol-3-phosphate dehydrogenase (NAD(P)+)